MSQEQSIQQALENQKNDAQQQVSLSALKKNLLSGMFDEQQRKKKQEEAQMLIQNAIFLQNDPLRKKKWIIRLADLSVKELQDLIDAILRENIRYKKKERDIIIELNKAQAHLSIS